MVSDCRQWLFLLVLLGTTLGCGRDKVRQVPGPDDPVVPEVTPSDPEGTGGSDAEDTREPLRHPVSADDLTTTLLLEGSPSVRIVAAAAGEEGVLLVTENEEGLWVDLAQSSGIQAHALRVSGPKRQLRGSADSWTAGLSVLPSSSGFVVLENRGSGELIRYDLDASGQLLAQVEVATHVAKFAAARAGELLAWVTLPDDNAVHELVVFEGHTPEVLGPCFQATDISLSAWGDAWALAAHCVSNEVAVLWQNGAERAETRLPFLRGSASSLRLTETDLLVATYEESEVVLLAIDFEGSITERTRTELPPEAIVHVREVELSGDGSQLLVFGGEVTLERGLGNCHHALCRVSQDAIVDCQRMYPNQCGRLSWIKGEGAPLAIGARAVGSLHHSTVLTSALCDEHDHEESELGVHTEGITDPDGIMGTPSGVVQSVRPLGVSFAGGVPATLLHYGAGTTEWLQGPPLTQTGGNWVSSPGPYVLHYTQAVHIANDWYSTDDAGNDVVLTVGQTTKSPLPPGRVPPYVPPYIPPSLAPPHNNYWALIGPCAGRYYAADRLSDTAYQLVALDLSASPPTTNLGELADGSNVSLLCDDQAVAMGLAQEDGGGFEYHFYDHDGVHLGSQSQTIQEGGYMSQPKMVEGLLLLTEPDHLLIMSPERTLPVPLVGHRHVVASLEGEHLVVFWHDKKMDLFVTEGRVVRD